MKFDPARLAHLRRRFIEVSAQVGAKLPGLTFKFTGQPESGIAVVFDGTSVQIDRKGIGTATPETADYMTLIQAAPILRSLVGGLLERLVEMVEDADAELAATERMLESLGGNKR